MELKKKYTWPSFSLAEGKIVSQVLRSNHVNYLFGSIGKEFEKKFSAFSNTHHALALANGTLALDACLRSLRLSHEDEVLVTSRSFIASASSIALLGATPIWCDVDLNSQNILLDEIIKRCTKRTKGIICVHFAGFPCEMDSIMEFAKAKNLFVVEDCAQAHGAKINGISVGSFGHMSAWSFCNDKIMTLGGEGGMITTNDVDLYDKAASFNNHGKNLKKYFSAEKYTHFPYLHDSLGSNYRLTEMQSALGIYQLNKMDSWTVLRARNANIFINAINELEVIQTPVIPKHLTHAWYKLYITLNPSKLKKSITRSIILQKLQSESVPCSFGGSGEIYLEKAFSKSNLLKRGSLSNASFLENYSIMLEVHPTIPKKEVIRRASVLKLVLKDAQK